MIKAALQFWGKACLFSRQGAGLIGYPLGDKKEHWPPPSYHIKHLNVKVKTQFLKENREVHLHDFKRGKDVLKQDTRALIIKKKLIN